MNSETESTSYFIRFKGHYFGQEYEHHVYDSQNNRIDIIDNFIGDDLFLIPRNYYPSTDENVVFEIKGPRPDDDDDQHWLWFSWKYEYKGYIFKSKEDAINAFLDQEYDNIKGLMQQADSEQRKILPLDFSRKGLFEYIMINGFYLTKPWDERKGGDYHQFVRILINNNYPTEYDDNGDLLPKIW